MTNEDLLKHPGHEPTVLLADGKFGMLILWPGATGLDCGVQIPGDEDTRVVLVADLERTHSGALRQRGAPENPVAFEPVQAMLAGDWRARGGLLEDWY